MAAHGRYSLLHKIAEGGTAEVFLAHQLGSAGFKRLVVLKRVRPGLWADESFRRMLIDEAHISMALHHSNIVQVLDLGMSGPHYFLVFELVDGWSLSQVVKRARAAQLELPLNLALHVMAQVCRALAYAHSRTEGGAPMGIVHRDISPQNVLLSDQGEVKLADFGIAKARSRITTSQIGQVKGKPAYMSPEQATGAPLDARSDLFSLGTCLYWLMTGELPFSAPNELEAIARVVSGSFVPPEKKRSGLPKPIAKLITRALQHEVKDRFQSADEMLAELEKIQRGNVLPPAGQTELKAWLDALAAKDGARPVGWVEESGAKAPAPAGDQSQEIELVDDSDLVVMVTHESDAVPASPQPPLAPRQSGWQRVLAMTVVAAAMAVGTYWVARSPRTSPSETTPLPAATIGESVTPTQPMESSISGSSPRSAPHDEDASVYDSGPDELPAGTGALDGAVMSTSAGGAPTEMHGGAAVDAGHQDGGDDAGATSDRAFDAGAHDAGAHDAGAHDAGAHDAGAHDAGAHDAGAHDAGAHDAGAHDAGAHDAGAHDGAAEEISPAPPQIASRPPRTSATIAAKPPEPSRAPTKPTEPTRPTPKEHPTGTTKPGAVAVPAKSRAVAVPVKPAAITAQDMASVLVDSDPPGADLAIERKIYGKTPIPLRLKVGITFELVFTKPGFRTHKILYQVTSRQGQRVRVTLTRGPSNP